MDVIFRSEKNCGKNNKNSAVKHGRKNAERQKKNKSTENKINKRKKKVK
jgi:hypothetical protein